VLPPETQGRRRTRTRLTADRMQTPVVFQYQRALDEFRREGREPPLLKRMSELISLLDFTTTLNSSLSQDEILDAGLLIVMGELQVPRGCLLVRGEGATFRVRAARGLPAGAPAEIGLASVPESEAVVRRESGAWANAFSTLGLEVLCPVFRAGKPIALLGLGRRADGRAYGEEETGFLRSVAACAATPIENGLIYHELRQLNQKLSVKVFQLNNLFDISRELSASFDEETIKSLVTTTLMGHLMVSRCALYLRGPEGLHLAHERGPRRGEAAVVVPDDAARPALEGLQTARAVADLPDGPLKERLQQTRMGLVVPLSLGGRAEGFLAVGERASGAPFSEEDQDFAFTLGRQALAALENVRLQRVRLEQQRQDREMQIAREIQQSLFPRECPTVPGFELAAQNHPCYQVGGDHYDFIPLRKGKLALAIADVSGKGAPASILMASVHASLRALAGTDDPDRMMARLNRFLFASTQANKFVTLFYAELDPDTHCLRYINAGHVPPYHIGAEGSRGRLTLGGPALGLLDDVAFEVGEVGMKAGDLVAMVTDGATEALSPDEIEFGDERVLASLTAGGGGAPEILQRLVGDVHVWTGAAGCSDDLTALVLKAL